MTQILELKAWPGTQVAPVRLLECGCCGQFHPENSFQPGGSANPANDCRNNANRFNSDEDFTARTGLACVEVWLDEQEYESGQETGEICPKCKRAMLPEEIVVMDFAGRSIEHVNCPK